MNRWAKAFSCFATWHWMLMFLICGLFSLIAACYCIVTIAMSQGVAKDQGTDSSFSALIAACIVLVILAAIFFITAYVIRRHLFNIKCLCPNLPALENDSELRKPQSNRSSHLKLKKSMFWRSRRKNFVASSRQGRKTEIATISDDFNRLVRDVDVKVEINTPRLSRISSSEVRLSLSVSFQSLDNSNEVEDSSLCTVEPKNDNVVIQLRNGQRLLHETKDVNDIQEKKVEGENQSASQMEKIVNSKLDAVQKTNNERQRKKSEEQKILTSQQKDPGILDCSKHNHHSTQVYQDVIVEVKGRLGSLQSTKTGKKIQRNRSAEEKLSSQPKDPKLFPDCSTEDHVRCSTCQASQGVVDLSRLDSLRRTKDAKDRLRKKSDKHKLLPCQQKDHKNLSDCFRRSNLSSAIRQENKDVELISRLNSLGRAETHRKISKEEKFLSCQKKNPGIFSDFSIVDQFLCSTCQISQDVLVGLRSRLDSLRSSKSGKKLIQRVTKAEEEKLMPCLLVNPEILNCSQGGNSFCTTNQESQDDVVGIASRLDMLQRMNKYKETQKEMSEDKNLLPSQLGDHRIPHCSKNENYSYITEQVSQDAVIELKSELGSRGDSKNVKGLQKNMAEEVMLSPGRLEDSPNSFMDNNEWIRTLKQKKWMYIHHMREISVNKSWIFASPVILLRILNRQRSQCKIKS